MHYKVSDEHKSNKEFRNFISELKFFIHNTHK